MFKPILAAMVFFFLSSFALRFCCLTTARRSLRGFSSGLSPRVTGTGGGDGSERTCDTVLLPPERPLRGAEVRKVRRAGDLDDEDVADEEEDAAMGASLDDEGTQNPAAEEAVEEAAKLRSKPRWAKDATIAAGFPSVAAFEIGMAT